MHLIKILGKAALIALLALVPLAAKSELAVVVVSADGTRTPHALAVVDRIDIGSDALTIHRADGTTQSSAYADIDRVLLGVEWDSVKDLLGSGDIAVWPTRTQGAVHIGALEAGTIATAYTLGGAEAATATAGTDGIATLDLGAAPAGVYIVAAAGKSVKVVKY